MKTFTEDDWDRLITRIRDENVIPIIGEELLITEYNGKEATLYEHIAQYICEKENFPYEEGASLSDVMHFFRKHKKSENETDANTYLYHINDFLNKPELTCEPLELLAKIDGLKMFISTTFDDLVYKALKKSGRTNVTAKHWVEQKLSDTVNTHRQDIDDKDKITPNLVFHLFSTYKVGEDKMGKKDEILRRSGYCAITDDDILMYLSRMGSGKFQESSIAQFLRKDNVHLLLLGWSHSDWLSRFLFYTLKRDKIYLSKNVDDIGKHKIYLADNKIKKDASLIKFIERLNYLLYDKGDIAFIKELYDRWPKGDILKKCPKKTGVFLSYASEDEDIVQKIYEWLKDEFKCPVWFDKAKEPYMPECGDAPPLEPGDDWSKKIHCGINDCKVFIPILSKNAIKARAELPPRVFLEEWEAATQRKDNAHKYQKNFIIPLVIDGANKKDELFATQFGDIHILDFDLKNEQDINVVKNKIIKVFNIYK
jgi:hypothetical protein